MPKSSSLTWPSGVTSTLDGLRSRWTIRFACACATASRTSRNSVTRARHIQRIPARQYWSMGSPSTCSMTRYGWPDSVTPASTSCAICGCDEAREDMASFALGTRFAAMLDEGGVQEFDRGAACEAAVAALGAARPCPSRRRPMRRAPSAVRAAGQSPAAIAAAPRHATSPDCPRETARARSARRARRAASADRLPVQDASDGGPPSTCGARHPGIGRCRALRSR